MSIIDPVPAVYQNFRLSHTPILACVIQML